MCVTKIAISVILNFLISQIVMFCNAIAICNSQSNLAIIFVSLLEFARIILNLLETYALYSAAVVHNYSRFFRFNFNGVLFFELL